MFTLSARMRRRIANACNSAVAAISSVSIVMGSVTHSYAQTITIGDPSAPGTGFLQTSNGTPQIDIATPQSGVSVNKFTEFSVGSEGLILNNSTTGGVSIIGQNVTANPNLVSGPANVIVNEVTSAAPSNLVGTTEVFGQKAAVIIANPNGIACNGCSFLNSSSSTLTTGTPTVTGSDVDLLVTQGTITVGSGGFAAGDQAGIFGRHVIVNGEVRTTEQGPSNSIVVSGGSQQATALDFEQLSRTSIVAAPSLEAKTSPFAVDLSEAGRLTGGDIRVYGRETDQGVNIYGDVDAQSFEAHSAGGLFYQNITSQTHVTLSGRDVRQYGDLTATQNVTISGDSFTLYDGRKILTESSIGASGETVGKIEITVDDYAVIAGEISGAEITVNIANGSLTNNGFLLSDGDLTVVAGDSFLQQRKIATEYDVFYDPVLQNYLAAYYAQLLDGGEAAVLAAELIERAGAHEIIAEYIDDGATATGTNITVTAATGDVRNTGGAIAATNNVVLSAGNDIINEFLALRSRLNVDDGCPTEDCGYRTDFHAGEILAGGDLNLVATLNIENRASDIAAAQNIMLTAGADVINSLKTSNYQVGEFVAVDLIGPRYSSCGKDCSTVTNDYEYTAQDLNGSEVNVLSPARIVSLYGNVEIAAGSDFISQGSEVSSGADLTIAAAGQVALTSYVDDERNFIERTRLGTSQICGAKDSGCSTGIINVTTTDESFVLAAATSNLVGQSIGITSEQNLTILGARILASIDLDLTSTNGSVLIGTADLPDTIALDRTQDVELVELTDDLVGQIFRPVDFEQQRDAYEVIYTSLLGDSTVASATGDAVTADAVAAVLTDAVEAWRLGQDDLSAATDISAYLAQLQTDAPRRDALVKSLLLAATSALETQSATAGDSLASGLDEYAILQQLITDDASAAALDNAALTLLDSLLPQLLTQTQNLEASLLPAAALPELTPEFIAARESVLIDEIIAELVAAIPTDGSTESTAAFEGLSVDQNFMQMLAVRVANSIAQEMGRSALFGASDAEGIYGGTGQLVDIESAAALQRIVLEISLILSPGNPDTTPSVVELSALLTDGTSTDANILTISESLSEFADLALVSVSGAISESDKATQAEAVLALEANGLNIDSALSNALVDALAGALGAQAATNYQNERDQNSSNYAALLNNNNLLTAVEALARAQSGADIKDATRGVGVQSFVSLIDSDVLLGLKADADLAINSLESTFVTDVGALNSEISDLNSDIRAQAETLTGLITAPDAEVQAAMQGALDQVQADYDSTIASADEDYQDQLAASQAQYGHLLTTTELRTRQAGSGKSSYTEYYYVTVPNTYYVDLKNAADTLAADTHTVALSGAETQRQLNVLSTHASFTDDGLAGQIADLQAEFTSQHAGYASQKTSLFAVLNTQLAEVISKVQLIAAQEVLEDELRATVIAVGTVDAGAPSLAAALNTQEFGERSETDIFLANADGVIESVPNGQTSGNALISASKEDQDAFLEATAWRFTTIQEILSQSPLNQLLSQQNLTLVSQGDAQLSNGSFDAAGTLNVTSFGDLAADSVGLTGGRVNIVTSGDFTGLGVAIDSDSDVNISAVGAANISSLGRTYSIATGEEHIIGTLAAKEWDVLPGQTVVSQELSSINADGDLVIDALGDLTLGGVNVDVADNVGLSTLNNLTLSAPTSEVEYHSGSDRNGTDSWTIQAHVTDILSGGDFSGRAGDTALLEGAKIDAGGTLELSAVNDLTLSAARDVYEYQHRTYSSGLFNSKSSQTAITRLIHQGASLSADGDLNIESETGNLVTAGSSFTSRTGNINLSATLGDILAGTYTDVDRYAAQSSKSSFFGFISSSYSKLTDYRNTTGTEALAELDLTLVSGGDTELVGAQLSAGRDLNLNVGGDLNVLAAISSAREEFFESKLGAVFATTVIENSFKETAVTTSLDANGELSISVDGDTYLTLYNYAEGENPTAADLYPDELLALANLILLDEELLDEYFYDETKSLSPAFIAIVTIVITAGYGWYLTGPLSAGASAGAATVTASGATVTATGAAGAAGLTSTVTVAGVSTTSLTLAGHAVVAAATSATIGVANGAVSGDLDIGEILKNAAVSAGTSLLTSSINLRAAGQVDAAGEVAQAGATATNSANTLGEVLKSTNKSFNLLGGDWTGLNSSLFGNGNLSVSGVLEGAFDGAVSSGISSAAYGTNFRDGFKSSLVRSVVALGLADAQNEIGDIFTDTAGKPINGGEGSIGHVLLHGLAGCAAAEAGGADCGAGAAGGIAQALYAGTDPLGEGQSTVQVADTALLIGALAGYLFSGGDAENVSTAGSVSQSGAVNNYLTHAQVQTFAETLKDCKANVECRQGIFDHFVQLSLDQNDELVAAINADDRDYLRLVLDQAPGNYAIFEELLLSENYDTATLSAVALVLDSTSLLNFNGFNLFYSEHAIEALKGNYGGSQASLEEAAEIAGWIGPVGFLPPGIFLLATGLRPGAVTYTKGTVGLSDGTALRAGTRIQKNTDGTLTITEPGFQSYTVNRMSADRTGRGILQNWLKQHNTTTGYNRSNGIVGGHNQNSFNSELSSQGGTIIGIPHTDLTMPGVKTVMYKVAKSIREQSFPGELRSKEFFKTIYDPSVLSDQRVAQMSATAGRTAVFLSGKAQQTVAVDGYLFRVYRNLRTGEITNSHLTTQ